MALSLWEGLEVMNDPLVAGLTAGAIHHFVLQYPTQAQLFTTLYAFVLANIVFLILLLTSKHHFRGINGTFKDICIFDSVYVRPPEASLT
jgi:uncharacterized membrane protein YhhN